MSASPTAVGRSQRQAMVRHPRLLTFFALALTVGLRMLGARGVRPRRGWRDLARLPASDRRSASVGPAAVPATAASALAVRPPDVADLDRPRAPAPPAPGPVTQPVGPAVRPVHDTPPDASTPDPRRRRTPRADLALWAIALGVFAVTVGLRLFHVQQAYDVFLDESTYSRIAAGAAVDGRLVFGSFPFYLHGPLSFYLQAAWIHLFGITGTAIEVIYGLRVLNVLVAGVVSVLIFTIVRSVTSRGPGLLAAALFAFDPFIVSFDSRLYIETLATLWVALGFCLLLPLAGEDDHRAGTVSRRALAAGFVFGLALLTKETSAPLYVLPLLWCAARGRTLRRSSALTALLTALVTYLPYPLIVLFTGGGSEFWHQKFGGVERMLGLVQTTGLNRPGAPSFLSRVSADLGTFAMTYLLIAAGAVAAVWLYRRGTARQRLVAMWGVAALIMLAFQMAQGTLEEQMFYYLVVPSIVTVACSVSLVSREWGRHGGAW